MQTCTYLIRHRETGRTYYGLTNSPKERWNAHMSSESGCRYLAAALSAHGREAFDFEVLEWHKSRKAAAAHEFRLLHEAEKAGEPLYNLRLPSSPGGLQNFAWGKKAPWKEPDYPDHLPPQDDPADEFFDPAEYDSAWRD